MSKITGKVNYKEVLKGDTGYTFEPHVTVDGILYWTNNGNLENPLPVNIKGKDGDILQREEINKLNYKVNISPTDFGATGKDPVIDTIAFKECFDYANNNKVNVIIRGSYKINESITINGTYTVYGDNAEIICNSEMDNFIIIDKNIENLNLMKNEIDCGLNSIKLDGNGKCNNTLFLKQGKSIKIHNLMTTGGKNSSCYLGSSEGQLWELDFYNCTFNANTPNGHGNYALYMNTNISDSYFTNIYCINGKINWGYIKASSSYFKNIHGYSYPIDKACETGFYVYGSGTFINGIICDTPSRIGVTVEGQGTFISDITVGKYTNLNDELIACFIKGNHVSINNLESGVDINNETNRITAIKLDTENVKTITDFRAKNIIPLKNCNKDIVVTGKIPYRFEYDKYVNCNESIKDNNFIHYNVTFYIGETEKTVNFRNEFSTSLYEVLLFTNEGNILNEYTITKTTKNIILKLSKAMEKNLILTIKIKFN